MLLFAFLLDSEIFMDVEILVSTLLYKCSIIKHFILRINMNQSLYAKRNNVFLDISNIFCYIHNVGQTRMTTSISSEAKKIIDLHF